MLIFCFMARIWNFHQFGRMMRGQEFEPFLTNVPFSPPRSAGVT